MNAAELKNYLVKQLIRIEDEAFLKALKVIIDSSMHTHNDDQEVVPQASIEVETEEEIDLQESVEEKAEREIAAWLKDID